MKKSEWEQVIFTVNEKEWMIFTVHKWVGMMLWYAHFQDLVRNDQEMTEKCLKMTEKWPRMNGKYHSWLFMIDITCSHLLFMNGRYWDVVKQPCPANISYHPKLSCSVPFSSILSMAISLMLAVLWRQSQIIPISF